MKNLKTLYLISCLVLIIMFSCAEKKEANPRPSPAVATRCRPESSVLIGSSVADSIRYTYDASGKLEQRTYFNAFTGNFAVSDKLKYDSNGRLYQRLNDAGKVYEQRKYNASGLLINIEGYHYEPNGNVMIGGADIEYASTGKLKKESEYLIESGIKRINRYTTFTIDQEGSIIRDSIFSVYSNGTTAFFSTAEYSYDDKVGLNEFGIEPSSLREGGFSLI